MTSGTRNDTNAWWLNANISDLKNRKEGFFCTEIPADKFSQCDSWTKLTRAVIDAGHKISGSVTNLMQNMSLSGVSENAFLLECSNDQLGYPDGCTLDQTFKAALGLNLTPCLPEDGLLGQIAFANQATPGGRLMVAMNPVTDTDTGKKLVFILVQDNDGSTLDAVAVSPNDHFDGDCRWMFRMNAAPTT